MQKRKWGTCLAVALCWLAASSANAASFTLDSLPSSVLSDNGQLEFANFQFFSPFHTVDAADVTLTTLADGIQLSGPLTVEDDFASFFLLYEVQGVNAPINRVSLQLDSEVNAPDGFGLVLSTKQILGDRITKPGKEKKDRFFEHDFKLGYFGYKTLAHLKTADWQFGNPFDPECRRHRPSFGLGNDGAIRLVEAGIAARDSIRVVEGVSLSAFDGSATWESSTNRFRVVPEPGTAGALFLGLALLAGRARRDLTPSR